MPPGGETLPEVSTQNATIDYEIHGAGPSLVLINGMGFGRWGFFKQVPALSRRFATITFDAKEGRNPEGVIEGLASDAADLLAHLGVGRAHFLGTSLGGFVAQELALSRPELVGRLVLECTSYGGRGPEAMSPGAMADMMGLGAFSAEAAARKALEAAAGGVYRAEDRQSVGEGK